MRSSRWVPIAGWCLVTATSIVISSVALSPVLNAATPNVGALPDLGRVPAAEVAVTTTSATPPPAATTEAPAPAEDEPETATAEPSRTSRKPTSKPATAEPTTPPATTEPPAAATTKPATTTEDGWTVTTGEDGLKTYVKTFTTEGGRAVLKMVSDGTVFLVTATPADGWTVQKNGSDTNLAVYFNETGHSFIIHAQWFNGSPFVEVSEVGE